MWSKKTLREKSLLSAIRLCTIGQIWRRNIDCCTYVQVLDIDVEQEDLKGENTPLFYTTLYLLVRFGEEILIAVRMYRYRI